MAGFLAPQISPVGGVQGAPVEQAVTDTSVGDALSNVSNIFDAVIQSSQRQGTTSTQTDRDRAGLQRFTRDINRIGKLVRSGQMSSTEANARVSSKVIEASTLFPDKTTEIKNFASSVLGTEILEPQEDPIVQAQNSLLDGLLNSEDPRDQRILRKAMQASIDPDTGVADQDRFMTVAFQLQAEKNARQAQTAALQDEVERAEAVGKLDNARQDQIAEVEFNNFTQETREVVDELVVSFAGQGEQINVSDALQSVMNAKADLMGQFTERAAGLRITDNIRTKFGGLEEAIRPLTVIENQLRNSRQEDVDAAQARAAIAPDRFAQALQEAGLHAGIAYTEEGQNLAVKHLLSQHSDKIRKAITSEEVENISTFMDNPFYESTKGEGKVDTAGETQGSETVVNSEGQSALDAATKEEATRMVKSGINGFLLKDDYDNLTEREQRFTVDNFAIGLEAMTLKGLNFNESSFDRLYGSDKFWDTYNGVVEQGGPQANVLNNSVRRHLRSQRLLKEADVNADLSAVENMPGTELVFNGERYTIQLPSIPRTEAEEAVLEMLKENDLPRTLEGLKQLRAPRTTLPRGTFSGRGQTPEREAAFRAIPQLIDQTRDNLRLLNKIAGTVPKLNEGARSGILPLGSGGRTDNVVEINSREELESQFGQVPDGTIFEVQQDGQKFRAQKINGQLVPVGGR